MSYSTDSSPNFVHILKSAPRWTQTALVEFTLRYGRQRPDATAQEAITAFLRYWNRTMVPDAELAAADAWAGRRLEVDTRRAMRRIEV